MAALHPWLAAAAAGDADGLRAQAAVQPALPALTDSDGKTALHHAAAEGHLAAVLALAGELGLQLDARTKKGACRPQPREGDWGNAGGAGARARGGAGTRDAEAVRLPASCRTAGAVCLAAARRTRAVRRALPALSRAASLLHASGRLAGWQGPPACHHHDHPPRHRTTPFATLALSTAVQPAPPASSPCPALQA
jgi:hypothetical protein